MPSHRDPSPLAEAILKAADPAIREAETAKRPQIVVWTFEEGAWDAEKAAFRIVKERLAAMGYSSYLGIDGNDDYRVSNREFVVVDLPKKQ